MEAAACPKPLSLELEHKISCGQMTKSKEKGDGEFYVSTCCTTGCTDIQSNIQDVSVRLFGDEISI